MTTTIVYLLISFSGPSWQTIEVVEAIQDKKVCMAAAKKLNKPGLRYECQPRVVAVFEARK
jgi:hypothetical protein